jgi:hypothetical protein
LCIKEAVCFPIINVWVKDVGVGINTTHKISTTINRHVLKGVKKIIVIVTVWDWKWHYVVPDCRIE